MSSSRKRSKMSNDDDDKNHYHVASLDDDALIKRSRTSSPDSSKTPAVDSSVAWGLTDSALTAASSSTGMAPAATTSTTGNSNGGFQFGTHNTFSTNWQPNSNPFPNAAAMSQPSRQLNFLTDDSSNKKPPIEGTPNKQRHSNRPPLPPKSLTKSTPGTPGNSTLTDTAAAGSTGNMPFPPTPFKSNGGSTAWSPEQTRGYEWKGDAQWLALQDRVPAPSPKMASIFDSPLEPGKVYPNKRYTKFVAEYFEKDATSPFGHCQKRNKYFVFPCNKIGLDYLAEALGRKVLDEAKEWPDRKGFKLGYRDLQHRLSNTAFVSGTHVMLDSKFCTVFEKKLRQLVVEAVAEEMVSGEDSVFNIVGKLFGEAAMEYYTTKVVGFGSEVHKQMLTIVLQETVEDTVETLQLEDGMTLDTVVDDAVAVGLLQKLSSDNPHVSGLTGEGAVAVVKDGAIELMAEKAARKFILDKQNHNALDLETSLSQFWSGGVHADKYLSLAKQRVTDLDVFLGVDHVKWLEKAKKKHPNAADSSQEMVPPKLLQDTVIELAKIHSNEHLESTKLANKGRLESDKLASEERRATNKQTSEDLRAILQTKENASLKKEQLAKEERLATNQQNLAFLQAALSPSNRAPPHQFSSPAQMHQQQPSASMVFGGGAVQQFSQGSFGGGGGGGGAFPPAQPPSASSNSGFGGAVQQFSQGTGGAGGGPSTAQQLPASGNSGFGGAVQQFSLGTGGAGGGFPTAPPTPPSSNSVFTAPPPSSSSNSASGGTGGHQISQGTGGGGVGFGAGGGFPTAQQPPASSNSGFGGTVQHSSPQGIFLQSSSSNPFAGSWVQSGFGATAQQQQQQSGGVAFGGSAPSSQATPPCFGASATTQSTFPQQQPSSADNQKMNTES